MKLQYLGDARDAFKWDLLNWVCRRSLPAFKQLVFVPMLTPDIHANNEGNVPHHRFDTPIFLQQFLVSLRTEPRTLARIKELGWLEPGAPPFQVLLHGGDHHYLPTSKNRSEYWSGFQPETLENSVIFFDPDNGFETKTRRSSKWVRHDELQAFLSKLPNSSVVVVYQHRPRKTWRDLFQELSIKLDYAHTAVAAVDSNLAFVALAKDQESGERITKSISAYAHSKIGNKVSFAELRGSIPARPEATNNSEHYPAPKHRSPSDQIWNCAAPSGVRCHKSWHSLGKTDDLDVHFCESCQNKVYLCTTPAEFVDHLRHGKCVAMPPGLQPENIGNFGMGTPSPSQHNDAFRALKWWRLVLQEQPELKSQRLNDMFQRNRRTESEVLIGLGGHKRVVVRQGSEGPSLSWPLVIGTDHGFSPLGRISAQLAQQFGYREETLREIAYWNHCENERVTLVRIPSRNPKHKGVVVLAPTEHSKCYQAFAVGGHGRPYRDFFYNVTYEALALAQAGHSPSPITQVCCLASHPHDHPDAVRSQVEAIGHYYKTQQKGAASTVIFGGCCTDRDQLEPALDIISDVQSVPHCEIRVQHGYKGEFEVAYLEWGQQSWPTNSSHGDRFEQREEMLHLLKRIKAEIKGCTKCEGLSDAIYPLGKETGLSYITPAKNVQVLFVAESPPRQGFFYDETTSNPFRKKLFSLINATISDQPPITSIREFNERGYFLADAIHCRWDKSKRRGAITQIRNNCASHLRSHIVTMKPKAIVLLGKMAQQSFESIRPSLPSSATDLIVIPMDFILTAPVSTEKHLERLRPLAEICRAT